MRRHLPPDLYLYNKEIYADWHDGFYKIRDRLSCSNFHNHPMVKLKHGLMIDAFQFSFLLKVPISLISASSSFCRFLSLLA